MEKYLLLAMFCQVLLTFAVMIIMGRRRFSAARNKQISMQDFKTMQLNNAGEDVRVADRNFINQFEIPVLFYIACLTGLIFNSVSYLFVGLAFAFVLTRVAHTIVHVGANKLKLRYYLYISGCFIIIMMWVLIIMRAFTL